MKNFKLFCFSVITIVSLLTFSCSFSTDLTLADVPEPNNLFAQEAHILPDGWKTIEDGMWGFRIDVPGTLEDKHFEGKSLWIHENDQMRVIIDFRDIPSPKEFTSRKNYKQTLTQINGYNALVCTFIDELNPKKKQYNKVALLIFQESPRSYDGIGKPPMFRVDYIFDENLETAMEILQTVRFFES